MDTINHDSYSGPPPAPPVRGFILEDHRDSTQWLSDALNHAFPGIEIRAAETLAKGRQILAGFQPCIALIDLGLPDGSGLEIIESLHHTYPSCHCVVTTIFADDTHLFSALQAGANGYILKEQQKAQLAQMLAGIVEGKPPLSPQIARRILRFFQPQTDSAIASPLSERQSEVLAMIARGMTAKQVAKDLHLSPNTVSGYIKEIYRRLNVSTRAEATLKASRLGLIDKMP